MEVRFENITLLKGKKSLLKDVSFVSKKGEITTFLGDSSSPIDSIFQIIMKRKCPTKGLIYIDGQNISKLKNNPYKIGYMNGLIEERCCAKTVQEIFTNSLKLSRRDDFDDQEKIAMLQTIFLDASYLHRELISLSSGERKKVFFGAFLLQKADLFLIKDPFFLFTNREKKDFIQLLKNLRKDGKTILFATSDTSVALELSDFVYITTKDKILEGGNPEYILSDRKGLAKARLEMPPILDFIDTVKQEKNIKMLYRTEINDLIKDIYRLVR